MKTLTHPQVNKPSVNKKYRVHFKTNHFRTLCGITFGAAQETILEADCQRCWRILHARSRRHRKNHRLNGRRIPAGQTTINL